MKRKIKIGDLFYYEPDGLIGEIIKITRIGNPKTYNKYWYKRIRGLKEIKGEMYFCKDSKMYDECAIGKTLDELWVRMI